VQGLAMVAKINEVDLGFASGGFIGDRGVHLSPDARGDNRLIVAGSSEVILNRPQQARIGAGNLKAAGVPGFADGGIVSGGISQPIINDSINQRQLMNMFRNMKAPVVSVKEITQGQKRVRVKESVARI